MLYTLVSSKAIPYQLKKKIRSLERYGKKINNTTWSIMFNQTCLKENIMPKYCKFKKK